MTSAPAHTQFVSSAAREFVDVEDDVPLRLLGAVALQRGAPPQPARVLRVAPEVVEVVAASAHVRDAGIGVEHFERLGAHLLEAVAAELGERGLVVLAHPVQRVVAGDVLEPQVRVVVVHEPILAVPVSRATGGVAPVHR